MRKRQYNGNDSLRFLSSRIILKKRRILQKWNRFSADQKRKKEARDRSYEAAMRKFQSILASTKQHSFTKWARFTKKVHGCYAIAMTKFRNVTTRRKQDTLERWKQYVHDRRMRRIVEKSQMLVVLKMIQQQNTGICRRSMAKWHRLVLANKLEKKKISHREARMLDMMSNLLAKALVESCIDGIVLLFLPCKSW